MRLCRRRSRPSRRSRRDMPLQAAIALRVAEERFRRRLDVLPTWTRHAMTAAMRELAQGMRPFERECSICVDEVADLVHVPTTEPPPPPPVSALVDVPPHGLPPDKEGDEELLECRGRMRTGWRNEP